MALYELSRTSSEISRSEPAQIASSWLETESRSAADQLLAMRIVREGTPRQEVVSNVRRLTLDSPVALQMGAIAALGQLGNIDDIESLRNLAKDQPLLATAVERAVESLNN